MMQFFSDDVFSSRTSSRLVFRVPRNSIFNVSFVLGGKKVNVTELQLKDKWGCVSRSPDKRLIGDFSRGFLDRDSVATLRN